MTVLQNSLLALILFVLQPTFIIGLVLVFVLKSRRFTYSRNQLRASIYKDHYELKRFFLWGAASGLVLSLVSFLVGVPVSLDWILAYQLTTLLLMGLGYRFIHPIFTFTLSAFGVAVAGYFFPVEDIVQSVLVEWDSPFLQSDSLTFEGLQPIFVLTLLLLLSTVLTLHVVKIHQFTPRFLKTKRGKLVARYRMTPLWLVPLVVVVPGDTFTRLFDWWPVFSIGTETYSFLLIPVLLGFRYTVQAQMPTQAKNALVRDFLFLAGAGVLFFALSFWLPIFAAAGLLLLLAGGVFVLYRHRLRERQWTFRFGPAEEGLRVVAVRPESPAEKMGIEIGDTLIESNQVTLYSANDFTESLFSSKSYCKLKVRRIDGELIMVERALYEDDPHDLGLILLEQIETIR
ncbi:Cell division topological determinant MinJ [Alkalibacterium sp. AK22]|uniref:PDZ domain-containing protein n=1 Tax=Alkalibacterium sp. AK22 TaxID=1229520 RepID=UPI000446DB0F|nr:PDZ domain-containing protein [Alkalibacterium sp. AK22]EXJ23580.1 Cell division topological determinant MinJ [Alkalibacterium sp. AK22]